MTRWRPEFDPMLIRLHSAGHPDTAITAHMLDMGYAVDASDVAQARKRLALFPNRKKVPNPWRDESYPPPKERQNPLQIAAMWLGSRLEERSSGFWLDRQPASMKQVMQETNRLLAKNGSDMVGPPEWKP